VSAHQWRRALRRVGEVGPDVMSLGQKRLRRPPLAGACPSTQVQSATVAPGDVRSLRVSPVPGPDEVAEDAGVDATTRSKSCLATSVVIGMPVEAPRRDAS